jgi:hypothetical protein
MTATELINLLKDLPPDTRIVVRGYEDGYNDILALIPRSIKLNTEAEWYVGEYMDSEDADAISAIELFGENRIAEK